jgi:hypothetical protein
MEKAGIPTVTFFYEDQLNYHKQTALKNGVPGLRYCMPPRIGTAEETVGAYYDNIVPQLMDPLTEEEQQSGLYSPPAPPRIAYEGTINEAHAFFEQTTLVENCRNCPIATWTDGLPIKIPTEEAVAEMLTGTSHDPSEPIVRYREKDANGNWIVGNPLTYARAYTATVEKVAICAVMAGCKPEYLPVVLSIATTGGGTTNCPGTSSMIAAYYFVSGPIAKEIGMNPGQNSMDVGNYANCTIGRTGALMSINFGGCITGLVRTDSGNPMHSVCFAEDLEGLPQDWVGFNQEESHFIDTGEKDDDGNAILEQVNYTANESVLGKGFSWGFNTGWFSFPGYYRSLNSGTMGIARWLGVEGVPGKYNWLEAILPMVQRVMPTAGSAFFVLHPNLAELLRTYGFTSKQEVYDWMYEEWTIPVYDYYNSGFFDHMTDGGTRVERTNPDGLTYNELLATNPDYPLHSFNNSCIVVGDGFADEHWYYSMFGGRPGGYPIDVWR